MIFTEITQDTFSQNEFCKPPAEACCCHNVLLEMTVCFLQSRLKVPYIMSNRDKHSDRIIKLNCSRHWVTPIKLLPAVLCASCPSLPCIAVVPLNRINRPTASSPSCFNSDCLLSDEQSYIVRRELRIKSQTAHNLHSCQPILVSESLGSSIAQRQILAVDHYRPLQCIHMCAISNVFTQFTRFYLRAVHKYVA